MVAVVAPVLTIWLAAPLGGGCQAWVSGWGMSGNGWGPFYCTWSAPFLVLALTLPTFVVGLVALFVKRTRPFGLAEVAVGFFVWLYLIVAIVITAAPLPPPGAP